MRKLTVLIGMFLFLMNLSAGAQLCPAWDDATYYQPGDRVIHNGAAYEALVMIWFWPPPHPIYWEEIPLEECLEDECNLQIQLHQTGSVTVDTLPDGTVGTFDFNDGHSVNFDYFCGAGITLKAQPYAGYKFLQWDGMQGNPANPVISITLDTDTTIDPVFIELEKCTLTIQLNDDGSVALEYMPDGTVGTFNSDYAFSVQLSYTEGDTVRMLAIPDDGYAFVDWGDAAQTATNPFSIVMDKNYEFQPAFETGTTEYKYPAECGTGENMKVDGRSRFYGKTELCDGADIMGSVYIMNKLNIGEVSTITPEKISISGTTVIRRESIVTDDISAGEINAGNMEVSDYTNADNIVAEQVRVTREVFPDFVFHENYPLRTIDDLDEFIQKNGCLPAIPSEQEVRDKGIDLGDMSANILQKIEEMTLYIIQLEKRAAQLKTEK